MFVRRQLYPWLMAVMAFTLSGCGVDYRVFHPVGPVARAEWHYTLLNTGIMMLIIVPTTIAVCVFAFRYRKSRNATYDPTFSHSMLLELGMWGVPLIIVVILAFAAYSSVFAVDPTAPTSLDVDAGPAAPALSVDVITTDWQWIFVYPQLKIATIDDLVVPQGQTVKLDLTSATVVNDFYIPQVAPMIDVMPGMRTRDAFRVDQTGSYEGFSADFSGAGFSWMQFSTRFLSPADFAAWVKQTQAAPNHLDFAEFLKIAQPTINQNATPAYFSDADPDLFRKVYDATRNGEIFPVPEDVEAKSPDASPVSGKPGEIKAKS
jgi:cytochrome o ubiquinol oxidase subunit 2